MPTGIHLWSQTAGTNATADSSINMAEGMAPSAVNDGIRALMARVADWLKDLAGITSGGTATAYTVTTNRAFGSAAVMDGAIIGIRPNADSGASPTLAVDGLTARAINYSTGVAVPAGALKSGTPYFVVYVHASTEFILLGAPGALSPLVGATPVGSVLDYAGSAAPTGWLLCYGQSLLRSTYPALFTAIGTQFGAADGTHFSLPDCQGRVTAGKDNMSGVSADRLTAQTGGLNGDTLGAVGGEETHALTSGENAAHTHTGTADSDGAHTHFVANTDSDGGTNSLTSSTKLARFAHGFAGPNNELTGTATTPDRGLSSSGGAHTHTFTSASSGSGTAHNNVQPTIIFNKIIFTGV